MRVTNRLRYLSLTLARGTQIDREWSRTGELAVEPLALVLHLGLEAGRHLGVAAEAVLEQLEALRKAECIKERLADLEVAPAPPHARLGALLGRGSDERVGGVELLKVLDDGDDLRGVDQ